MLVLVHHDLDGEERPRSRDARPRRSGIGLPREMNECEGVIAATDDRGVTTGATSDALGQLDAVQLVTWLDLGTRFDEELFAQIRVRREPRLMQR